MGDLEYRENARRYVDQRITVALALRTGKVREQHAKSGGIHIRNRRQIDNDALQRGIAQCRLQREKSSQRERPFKSENGYVGIVTLAPA